ncbi:MAG: tRNA (adenosine(37)-N6)-threonylcarbamoyltransferase complex dimerization subunit type 1 TsaB [Phycisphaeraceae bacterium]|nr:tRNA (adenosine(37)-N6)-threonylcarbamoyltransferase complex dimerization subunit type 1 TsaB [Phycisphaeraceae bacterium]MCB9846948.1 tRNA (adenosine(37)-N6)-threonylcarbamoyltransferase complex dimerization subunit type 1 TsaB [Phycisphaeraceae bacterium]
MPGERANTITLAIEMSNPSMWPDPQVAGDVAIGVAHDDRIEPIGVEPITQDSPHGDALAPAIDRLLRRNSVAPADLTRVAVSAGPGGFTSVRLAVTTAKVLAEAVDALVVVVPTSDAVARTIIGDAPFDGDMLVTLAGKRDTAWCALYELTGWRGGALPSPKIEAVLSAEALEAEPRFRSTRAIVADAYTPEAILDWADAMNAQRKALRSGAAATLEASRWIDPVDPVSALPIYPREPEAVTKWRDRHGSTSGP